MQKSDKGHCIQDDSQGLCAERLHMTEQSKMVTLSIVLTLPYVVVGSILILSSNSFLVCIMIYFIQELFRSVF